MRRRLAAILVGLSLLIVATALLVGRSMLADAVRDGERDHLTDLARQAATVVEEQHDRGLEVSEDDLARWVSADMRLTVSRDGEPDLTADGAMFSAADLDEPLVVERSVGTTTVTLTSGATHVGAMTAGVSRALLVLMAAAALVAGTLALLVARGFSRPFAELAESAEALGRGRFDIEAPVSRVPEVAAVGAALRSSARNLEEQFRRINDSVQQTSHSLRTPLTALRLELEEILLRDDLDDDVRRTVVRCLADVTRLQDTVSELVDAERSRGVVTGRTVTLRDLAALTVDRWGRRLAPGRQVEVVLGDGGDLPVTHGPVEQVLDSVAADLDSHGDGPVSLHLEAEQDHVRIRVGCGAARAGATEERTAARTGEAVTEVLGGRWQGDAVGAGLVIVLPRR
ncbi:HAMP domain-containing protein [Nocardioides sp. S-58]|uniref:histidine kinase n=1 Tax=Nocardioides renjunii TaxID=3095075 RepID=A0ABU5K659_9ACTN|nr:MULTISPECIES: histidine kinase dimerization/phospho-acceptor domain-containing protein [unclassified Nocardioides]MDZ5660319.1 HAMP domain-containing protein [Nocardioides sp. S-58]WQQ21326.1 HAMP domain-containing protein [Nocardioides sp. S-34]